MSDEPTEPTILVEDRWYYSPSARGFFPADHSALPLDIVDVTPERHAELLDGQAAGNTIEMVDGVLSLVPHPRRPLADIVRDERALRLTSSGWIIERHQDELLAGRTPTLSPAQLAAWLSYRQALRDLPLQEAFPGAVVWPEAPA